MTALPPPVGDLAAWVGQDIPDSDPRAVAVLSAASSLVIGYAEKTTEWVADVEVPGDVASIVVQVAARVWLNPGGLQSVTVDDATRRWFDGAANGLDLTDREKSILDRFRTNASGLGVLSTTREDPSTGTIYVPTSPPPAGYPFPWYDASDPFLAP